MERVEELKKKLKERMEHWEEETFRFACDLASRLAREIIEEINDELMRRRDGDMRVITSNELPPKNYMLFSVKYTDLFSLKLRLPFLHKCFSSFSQIFRGK